MFKFNCVRKRCKPFMKYTPKQYKKICLRNIWLLSNWKAPTLSIFVGFLTKAENRGERKRRIPAEEIGSSPPL